MAEVDSNPTQITKVTANLNFVVNEFPRIKVPSQQKAAPEKFTEMNKIQRELILMRLIEKVDEI